MGDTVLAIAVATPLLDTLDLDTAVDTTEDSATAVATTASVRLRLSPSTDTLAWATLVLTPSPPPPSTLLLLPLLLPPGPSPPPLWPPLPSTTPLPTPPPPWLLLKLRPILTTDTATLELATLDLGATEDMDTVLDTAVATPLLDTLVLATAVATTDMDTATAVATDSMVRFTKPKEKRNSRHSANP